LWASLAAVPSCDSQLLLASACPPETVVGQLRVTVALGTTFIPLFSPLFNVSTTGSELAEIDTLPLPGTPPAPLSIRADVDGSDGYRLVLSANDIPGPSSKVVEIDATFLGNVAGKPFITNPASCDPAIADVEVTSWETASPVRRESAYQPRGCDAVRFDPGLTMALEAAAQPATARESKVRIEYRGYQSEAVWPSPLRNVDVTLPDGVAIAAAAAKDLEPCTPEQFQVDLNQPVACPYTSRVGTIEMESPVLRSKLKGRLFFGTPTASGRPTRERPWHLFLLLEGDALRVKLVGDLTLDERGRVRLELRELPPLPITRLSLDLDDGSRATPILTDPLACGEHRGDVVLTGWNGTSVTDRPRIDVSRGCLAAELAPALEQVSIEPTQAGASSTLRIVVARPDGQRPITSFSFSLPKGINGALGNAPRCSLSQARTGSCDESTRLGTILTTAGTGSDVVDLRGSAYLADAMRPGDAGTLAIVTPVRVGPIDLGRLAILARVLIRTSDGGIEVVTVEPPLVFQGIPLLLRRVELVFDRPGFFTNPTGCEPRPFDLTATSDDGRTISLSHSLSATGCESLRFSPKLRVIAGQRGLTTQDSHPPLRAIITHAAAESAVEKAVIAMPTIGMNLGQLKRPDRLCDAADLRIRNCPPLSHVGGVKVDTPLLPFPLSGPVFAIPDPGGPVPALGLVLRGGGLTLQLRAGNGIGGTTFEGLPDIPITRLKLRINGGREGVLTAFSDLCGRRAPRAEGTFTSQSRRVVSLRPRLVVNGCLKRAATIVNQVVRISRSGTARFRIRCRRQDTCVGRLSLVAERRLRAGKESFRISRGATRVVKLKLTAAGRRAVLRHRRLRATATVTVGNSQTTRRISLLAPRRSRK
jgi:hypothetical protein